VPGQASGDHDLLFAVAFQGEIDERPAEGGQLERRRPPALDDGQVAGGEVLVEFWDVTFDLDPVGNGQRRRVEPGPTNEDHPEAGNRLSGDRVSLTAKLQKFLAYRGPADGTNDERPGPVAEGRPDLRFVGISGRVEGKNVAQVFLWYMNMATFSGQDLRYTVADTNWRIEIHRNDAAYIGQREVL
jgi:hypothetical protein